MAALFDCGLGTEYVYSFYNDNMMLHIINVNNKIRFQNLHIKSVMKNALYKSIDGHTRLLCLYQASMTFPLWWP